MSESLKPVSGLEVIWRGVYEVDRAGHSYAVEVDFFDFAERIHLYRDGTRIETKRSPARFEAERGTVIEAAMGLPGMKKLRLVDGRGETALRPAAGTAEARRADFERRHARGSRLVGALAWLVLVVALVVEIPELIALAGNAAGFELSSPFGLPRLVTGALGVLALAAALDRALRFKRSRWLG